MVDKLEATRRGQAAGTPWQRLGVEGPSRGHTLVSGFKAQKLDIHTYH